ncbi:MAG TPA: hypothetical protein VHE54_00955 [Puia sp.]|nr:hypothetical protein [Puia sp.]
MRSFPRLTGVTLLLASLALAQCRKSGGSSNGNNGNPNGYYMRFRLDGAAVSYTSDPNATLSFLSAEGLYNGALATYSNINNGAKNAVIITLFSASAIAANVPYSDPQKARQTNGTQVPQAVVFWYDSTGVSFLTAGTFVDANGNVSLHGVVADAKVTITELTATSVRGTFSGTVYRPDFAVSRVISDGEFYLKRN